MKRESIYKSEDGKSEIISFYELLLEDWHKPNRHIIVPTQFGDTFVISCGKDNGESLVLLHGSGSNSAMWKEAVKVFAGKYKVYSIDIIGECGKSSESRPDFKGSSYSDWLSEVFEKLNISKAILTGSSLGGWIALDFTIRNTSKVSKLILNATAGITQVKFRTILLIMLTSLFGRIGFRILNKIVYGDLEMDKTVFKFATLIKDYFKPRTDLLPLFTDEQLNSIIVPVYFIGGEEDCFYNSSKSAERLNKHLKNVVAIVLPAAGHILNRMEEHIVTFIDS